MVEFFLSLLLFLWLCRNQCSQISWFITNSAILGMVSVRKFYCPWQVTRVLKVRDFRAFPKNHENPRKIPYFSSKKRQFCPKKSQIFSLKILDLNLIRVPKFSPIFMPNFWRNFIWNSVFLKKKWSCFILWEKLMHKNAIKIVRGVNF